MSKLNVSKSRKALLLDYVPPSLPYMESQLEELDRRFSLIIQQI